MLNVSCSPLSDILLMFIRSSPSAGVYRCVGICAMVFVDTYSSSSTVYLYNKINIYILFYMVFFLFLVKILFMPGLVFSLLTLYIFFGSSHLSTVNWIKYVSLASSSLPSSRPNCIPHFFLWTSHTNMSSTFKNLLLQCSTSLWMVVSSTRWSKSEIRTTFLTILASSLLVQPINPKSTPSSPSPMPLNSQYTP